MKCAFCNSDVPAGTGFKLFRRDGNALAYCSHKCERNAAMGRKPAKFKWTRPEKTAATKTPARTAAGKA